MRDFGSAVWDPWVESRLNPVADSDRAGVMVGWGISQIGSAWLAFKFALSP